MKLSLVLYQLRHGGLKQLSDIDKTDEVVVSYINMSVLKLYGRFLLEVKEAIITLQNNKVLYTLDSTDTNVLVNGLPIAEEEFSSILNVFSEAGEVFVNNEYDEFSVFTPTYNTIQVPTAIKGNFISILYRTSPAFLLFANGNSTDVNIKLPLVLLEPLIYYTAYLAHSSITSGIDTESHSYYMKYEAACKTIELKGLLTTNSSEIDTTANSKGLFL
tara:strand:+ start:172 stop:822 length:651 start_codon:yes stop_codon:yes gene_type:complete